jgi:hypothetical protein
MLLEFSAPVRTI